MFLKKIHITLLAIIFINNLIAQKLNAGIETRKQFGTNAYFVKS